MNEMAIRALVSRTESTCFLCKWIREDLDANGKLTGYPLDAMGGGTFAADGKRRHLELERMSLENR